MSGITLRKLPIFKDGNLINYWEFSNGVFLNDTIGGKSLNNINSTQEVEGKFGHCPYFLRTSSNYLISIDDIGIYGNSVRTINFWFKENNTSGINGVISWGTTNTLKAFTVILDYTMWFSSHNVDVSGSKIVNDNKWHMGTVMYDGTNIIMYVDAKLENQQAIALNTDNSKLYFGRTIDGNYYTGYLDDVSIFNRILTKTELLTLYYGVTGGIIFSLL